LGGGAFVLLAVVWAVAEGFGRSWRWGSGSEAFMIPFVSTNHVVAPTFCSLFHACLLSLLSEDELDEPLCTSKELLRGGASGVRRRRFGLER
jgi:hypothetical protein